MNYTFCQGIGVRPNACRIHAIWLPAMLIAFCPVLTASAASIFLGEAAGNDNKANVVDVIDDYNTANMTDLTTDITLFAKSDEVDPPELPVDVFDPANGFMFFSDEDGTTMINTEDELHALNMAWFKYTGSANLLYYSVKAGPDFNVSTFMPGGMLNKLQAPGTHDISHVSFWVPEPTSATLVGLALLSVAGMARRRRS